MDIPALIGQLEGDGPRLAAAAATAGWDAPVPATEWDVRTLVTHVGGVHRWAADAMRTSANSAESLAADGVGIGPADDELLAWFSAGHVDLVAALRGAPEELSTFTFLPADSSKHFWARRQAHETAIHRADAQGAAGAVTPFPADFAQDGMAELLHGFARRRSNAPSASATIVLRCSDGPSWEIRLGGERIEAVPGADFGCADVMVVGSSSELYLWLWNRPSAADVRGERAVADLWAASVRVGWS